MFKEQIGEEIDARDKTEENSMPQDISKMETIKQITERKSRKKEQINMRNRMQSVNGLKDITSHDKPRDLFKDLIKSVGNDLIKDDVQNWVSYKFKRYKLEKNLHKIKNLLVSRQITGPRFIMAWIKIFDITKQVFLLELEQDSDVLIPIELSQDKLPMSFRYYDPIIMLIQEKLSKNRRSYLMVKKQVNIIFDKRLSLEGQYN